MQYHEKRQNWLDGYTTDDITYRWKNTEPVQIAQGLNLPRFSVEKYASRYCNVKTNTGKIKHHIQNYSNKLYTFFRGICIYVIL